MGKESLKGVVTPFPELAERKKRAYRSAIGKSFPEQVGYSKALTLPVRLQIDEKEILGSTNDFTCLGLHLAIEAALAVGSPLALKCSFGEICYVNLSGAVISCVMLEGSKLYSVEIKFSAVRVWEIKLLASTVEALWSDSETLGKSFLIIHVSRDALSLEAADLSKLGSFQDKKDPSVTRADFIPRAKGMDHSAAAAEARREWLSQRSQRSFEHISVFSEALSNMQGNIENLIGVSHVPLGVAGPLKVNGDYANGLYYVPMATTEGAIVYTYTRGMQLISLSGGANTCTLRDEIHISPLFVLGSTGKARKLVTWLEANFERIKSDAEKTTRYGKLLRLEPFIFDRNVVVKFCYYTGDAMGLNMINIATEAACKFIVETVEPEEFYLRSNFSSVKKVSAHNYALGGFGKTVIADVVISRHLLKRLFNVTPEAMARYCHLSLLSSAHAGMIGMNGHAANGLTAIFIACGQDVANVVDSQASVSSCEVTNEGELYVSVKIPNLVVGTVGGGMALGTQRECLELLGCYGTGKAKKFGEIVAASVLAGEIGVAAAITTGTFVDAHKKYGRKTAPSFPIMQG